MSNTTEAVTEQIIFVRVECRMRHNGRPDGEPTGPRFTRTVAVRGARFMEDAVRAFAEHHPEVEVQGPFAFTVMAADADYCEVDL